MKKLIYFVIIVAVGYWLYGKCSRKDDEDVEKRVRVVAKWANLRTGPGTGYDLAVDHDSVQLRAEQGRVLVVIGEEDGWYQVRVDDDSCTAFIRQTLCEGLNKKSKTASQRKKRGEPSKAASTKRKSPKPDKQHSEPAVPAEPADDGVVEEVTGGSASQDDVIF